MDLSRTGSFSVTIDIGDNRNDSLCLHAKSILVSKYYTLNLRGRIICLSQAIRPNEPKQNDEV